MERALSLLRLLQQMEGLKVVANLVRLRVNAGGPVLHGKSIEGA